MQVGFEEPALVVSQPDKTRQLFPLSRVSRVVVMGHVDWRMAALLACADAGISILFLDEEGGVRSRWLGANKQHDKPLHTLSRLLTLDSAESCYRNWLKGMRRMAARSAARRLQWQDWQSADLDRLEHWMETSLTREWLIVRNWLDGLIASTVVRYLTASGFDSETESTAEWCVRLSDDLSRLLLADFDFILIRWSRFSSQPPPRKVLLQQFEARSHRLDQLIRRALSRLYRCAKELY